MRTNTRSRSQCFLFLSLTATQDYVRLSQNSRYRFASGNNDGNNDGQTGSGYEDTFPETVELRFVLPSSGNDDVTLRLRRNRNIESGTRVYLDSGHDPVARWNQPTNQVRSLSRQNRTMVLIFPCKINSSAGQLTTVSRQRANEAQNHWRGTKNF